MTSQKNLVYIDADEAFRRIVRDCKTGAYLFYHANDGLFQVVREGSLVKGEMTKSKQKLSDKIAASPHSFVGFYNKDMEIDQVHEDMDIAQNNIEIYYIGIFLRPVRLGEKNPDHEINYKGYARVSAEFSHDVNTGLIDFPLPAEPFTMPAAIFIAILDIEGVVVGQSVQHLSDSITLETTKINHHQRTLSVSHS